MGVKKIGNIVMIELSDIDSNIYLNKDAIIDTGTGFNFTRLKDVLRVFKSGLEQVSTIINTHYHFDHIGGNGFFTNAKIWIHQDDSVPLEKGDPETTVADFFGGNMHPMKVEKKLKEGDKVKFGDMDLEVIHTPGHTPGSVCLYDRKGKILFTGDTVMSAGFGRTDLPGGDPTKLTAAIDKILKLDFDKMLPGHGPPVDKPKEKIKQMLKSANFEPDEDSDLPV